MPSLNIVLWGKHAEACWQSLTVGSTVLIDGLFQMNIRTDRKGQKQKRLEVVAVRVCLL